jgi:uncharacterized protein
MPERPFLTARWSDLVLLNFAVPVGAIAQIVPPGTEPDLHAGVAYISIVGFRFENVRILGLPIPGHTAFDEINLRYYVKYAAGDEVRRGVVFIREIVPRRAVALVANRLYNENYVTHPMRSTIRKQDVTLAVGDTAEYAWRTTIPLSGRKEPGDGSIAIGTPHRWNRLGVRVAAPLTLPPAGSVEEFIVEHYWGYVRGRDGATREYRVAHPPWRVARADEVTWGCDLAANFPAPFAEYLANPPSSAIIAEGSAVQVFSGRRVSLACRVGKPRGKRYNT